MANPPELVTCKKSLLFPRPRCGLRQHHGGVAHEVPNHVAGKLYRGVGQDGEETTVHHVANDEAFVTLPPAEMEIGVGVLLAHAPAEAVVFVVFPFGYARHKRLTLQAVGHQKGLVQGLVVFVEILHR